jgi:putative transposase
MSIITRKIEIFVSEPDSEKRKEYYQTIRNWSYYSRNYANEIMSTLQATYFLDNVNKHTNPDNTKPLNDYLETSKRNLGYKLFTKKYKDILPSTFRSGINSYVYSNFGNTIKDVLKGDAAIISYKKDFPLLFQSKLITQLTETSFNFFSIPFNFKFGKDKSNNKSIVTKIINGEYQMGDSSFKFVDNKLFMFLVVKMPEQKFNLIKDKTLGVDLGIQTPAYISINTDKYFKQAIGSKEAFLHTRLSIQKHKRTLQKNLKYTKGGKGRNKKLDKLNNIGNKERNFAKTMNHTLSKEIVKAAIDNKCGMINIENLKGIAQSEKNSFILRNWSYFELQTMIQYKAKHAGITVNLIDPKYSSQRCHKCGHIHEDNRISQSIFKCLNCDFEDNADFNASKNIAIAHTKDYQKEIELHIKNLNKNLHV